METLNEFLDRKLHPLFWYEIMPDKVIFRFNVIPADQTISAIEISDNDELNYFHDLLGGRGIDLVGDVVEKGVKLSVITVQEYTGTFLSLGSNNIFLDGRRDRRKANLMTYFVMGYDSYYPSGGFSDCQGIYDDPEAATARANELRSESPVIGHSYQFDFIEIWIVENNELVLVKRWTWGKEDKL